MAQFLDKAGAQVIVDKINSLHADQETANELISGKVAAIEGKIPTVASSSNQLADKEFVASTYIPASAKGTKSGVATLDANGKIPNGQLPSYVDDVLEFASKTAFPTSGEDGKIYVAEDTNITYRWSGTAYVEISSSLALGETAQTAYAGNKGKANAEAIVALQTRATNIESKNTTQDTEISKLKTDLTNYVDLSSDQVIGGTKRFTSVEISESLNVEADVIFRYNYFQTSKGGEGGYVDLQYPTESGTLALYEDITWANLQGKPTIPSTTNLVKKTGDQMTGKLELLNLGSTGATGFGAITIDQTATDDNEHGVTVQNTKTEAQTQPAGTTTYAFGKIVQAIVNGKTYVITLPSSTGTLALKSELPAVDTAIPTADITAMFDF